MLYKVTTVSGAVYAIDTDRRVAGRITGPAPVPVLPETSPYNFTVDGEMRAYHAVKGICVGSRLAIYWTEDKVRVTSPVVSVENEPSTVVAK